MNRQARWIAIGLALALCPATAQEAAKAKVPTPPEPKIVETKTLPDTLDLARWAVTGPVQLTVSDKDAPGTQAKALRAEVLQTAEAFKRQSYTSQTFSFAQPQDWSAFNRLVQWVFVEPSQTPRGASLGVHLLNADGIRRTTGTYVVPTGKWLPVTWDITPMPRDAIGKLMVTQGVHRHCPGESDRTVYHFGRMELQRVEPPTKVCGWELQPHRVAFSHVGYPIAGEKTAIFHGDVAGAVRLMDADTGVVVWEGKLTPASHPRTGRFQVADFSECRREGRYVLVADGPNGPVATEPFPIGAEINQGPVRLMFDFYRAERCGDASPGYHFPCHLDDGRVAPYEGMAPEKFPPEVRALFGKHVDCSGGWHDAGDQAKFAHQEYDSAAQMLRLYERGLRYARPGAPRDAVLDEAIWGTQYALKTLLPTGRNCDRPEGVGKGVWTDNVPGNEDDRQVGMTTWNCVERYVAGMMAEAIAARVLREADPKLADRCLRQAKTEAEAYLTGARKDWQGNWMPLRYASVGLAFLELYRTTHEDCYRDVAVRCGDGLVACQEQGLAWNDVGVTGFWYEGPERRHPFAGSSGDGLQAYLLAELCRALPDHPSWIEWYSALRIYARFYALATAEYLTPYGVPAFSLHDGPDQPYSYWDIVHVLGEKKSRKLDFGFDHLVRIGPRYLVRIRHATSALNMNAATLAAVADLAHDPRSEGMAQRCFEWMLGRNPFSRSQIWGIGYRYREQPHYVATHDEMPGGIPCKGIDGRLDGDGAYHDEPYSDPLPRCVINEVCIIQGAYFLTAGRELAFAPRVSGVVQGPDRPAEILARFAGSDVVAARAQIGETGEYALTLPCGGDYEIGCGPIRRREFIASATDRTAFRLDLGREIVLSMECPETVRPGAPFEARVRARSLGKEPGTHELALRLHNATCGKAQQTIAVPAGGEAVAAFALTATRPSEPFLVLAIPDGELDKRCEALGVVGKN